MHRSRLWKHHWWNGTGLIVGVDRMVPLGARKRRFCLVNPDRKLWKKPEVVFLGTAETAIEDLMRAGKFEHAAAVERLRNASNARAPGTEDEASATPEG